MTEDQYLQVDFVGANIEVTVTEDEAVVDISTATVKTLIFKKPRGTVVSKTATFSTDGTDGKLKYITESGFLDQTGFWKVQAELTTPDYIGRTKEAIFTVRANL
jgi:hypothetical protein